MTPAQREIGGNPLVSAAMSHFIARASRTSAEKVRFCSPLSTRPT